MPSAPSAHCFVYLTYPVLYWHLARHSFVYTIIPMGGSEKGELRRVSLKTIYLKAQQHSFNCCLHPTTPPLLKYLLNKSNTIPKSKISASERTFKTFACVPNDWPYVTSCREDTLPCWNSVRYVHLYVLKRNVYMLWFSKDMNVKKLFGWDAHCRPLYIVMWFIIRHTGQLNHWHLSFTTHLDHLGAVSSWFSLHAFQRGKDASPSKGVTHVLALGKLLVRHGAPPHTFQAESCKHNAKRKSY